MDAPEGIVVFEKNSNSERLSETCFGQPLVEKAMEGFFNGLISGEVTACRSRLFSV